MKRKITPRNRLVLIALGVLVAISVGVFAWFSWQNGVFRQKVGEFNQSVNQTLQAANTTFKDAKIAQDLGATQTVLTALADDLDGKYRDVPPPPSLLGLQMGADTERAKLKQATEALQKSAGSAREIVAYLDYQQKTAVRLQLLSLKSAANYEQVIALAAAWQQEVGELQKSSVPSRFTEVNATLVQNAIRTQQNLTQLAELYKNNDEAGFLAKRTELEAAIAAFKPIGDEIARLAVQLDADLANNLTALRKSL